MSRPRVRTAVRGALLSSLTALLVVVTAPAVLAANDELAPREGAEVGSGMSVGAALLLFGLVPLVILLVVAGLVWLPGMIHSDRYRPQKGWHAPPVWFAGPPDPVAAVETADSRADSGRGGASGSW